MGNLKLSLEVKKDDNVTEDTTVETRINFKEKVLKVMKKLKKTDSKKTEEQKMQKKKQKETEAERWYQRDDMIDIDQYIAMFGGTAGAALTLTGVAAATAFYICTRPKPEKPLVTLHEQSLLETAQQAQLLP